MIKTDRIQNSNKGNDYEGINKSVGNYFMAKIVNGYDLKKGKN